MRRWPFFALAIASFTAAGVFAVGGFSSAEDEATGVVAVATLPPPPPRYKKLVMPRSGLFQADDEIAAELATPLPLPQLQQDANQAWVAASVSGVTAVSVAGQSAYAVIQTPAGSTIVRVGDMVGGKRVVGITACADSQSDCSNEGVTFDGGVFVPVGFNSAAHALPVQVPAIGGALPNTTVPVVAVPTSTPSAAPMVIASPPSQRPVPSAQASSNPFIHPMSPESLASPTVVNPIFATPSSPPEL